MTPERAAAWLFTIDAVVSGVGWWAVGHPALFLLTALCTVAAAHFWWWTWK